MHTNSKNLNDGKAFQLDVKRWFEDHYHFDFEIEKKIAIGSPPKLHCFDISDRDAQIVIECKCYTWTKTGNVPSAKMGFVNEAAFYLSFLDPEVEKFIVMLKDERKEKNGRKQETLAEYYFRTNRHLLGKIKIYEYDSAKNDMRLIGQNDYDH